MGHDSAAKVLDSQDHQTDAGSPVLRGALIAAVVITIGIAAASFVLSFTVLWDLATMAGLPRHLSWLWPVVVDGTILQATISVVALAPYKEQREGRRFFWSVLAASALISVSSNALHAIVAKTATLPPATAAAIATVAPISLLAATHGIAVLARLNTRPKTVPVAQVAEAPVFEFALEPEPAPAPVEDTQIIPAVQAPPPQPPAVDWDQKAAEMIERELTSRPAPEVAQILRCKFERDMSKGQIAKQVNVHHSTVTRVLEAAAEVLRPRVVEPPMPRKPKPTRKENPAAGVLAAVR